jgi:hypothetical protein
MWLICLPTVSHHRLICNLEQRWRRVVLTIRAMTGGEGYANPNLGRRLPAAEAATAHTSAANELEMASLQDFRSRPILAQFCSF